MRRLATLTLTCIIILFCFGWANAHGSGSENEKDTTESSQDSSANKLIEKAYADGDLTADFSAFPTLHPLVVHVPLIFLLLAAVAQVVAFFVFNRELSWVTLVLIAGGFLGAIVAIYFVHPHTYGLPERTQQVLEIHEGYATYTLWLSGIGLALKLVSHFYFNRKLAAELITVLVIVAAATFVSLTGHYGSQLAYIEGVGSQGKYLEQHD